MTKDWHSLIEGFFKGKKKKQAIDSIEKDGGISESPGVYIIRTNKRICRCGKNDGEGTWYIGVVRSDDKSLTKRVEEFYKATRNGKTNHSGGRRFHDIPNKFDRLKKLKLYVGWSVPRPNEPKTRKALEVDLLDAYFEEFGELPPLNSQKPKQKKK